MIGTRRRRRLDVCPEKGHLQDVAGENASQLQSTFSATPLPFGATLPFFFAAGRGAVGVQASGSTELFQALTSPWLLAIHSFLIGIAVFILCGAVCRGAILIVDALLEGGVFVCALLGRRAIGRRGRAPIMV